MRHMRPTRHTRPMILRPFTPLITFLALACSLAACGKADKNTSSQNSFASTVATFEGSYSQQGAACASGKLEDRFASLILQEQKSLDAGKIQKLTITSKSMQIESSAEFFGSPRLGCAITDHYTLEEAPKVSPSSIPDKSAVAASTSGSLKSLSSHDSRSCSSECFVDDCVAIEKPKTEDEKKKRATSTVTFTTKEGLLHTLVVTNPPMCRNAGVAVPFLRSWKKIP